MRLPSLCSLVCVAALACEPTAGGTVAPGRSVDPEPNVEPQTRASDPDSTTTLDAPEPPPDSPALADSSTEPAVADPPPSETDSSTAGALALPGRTYAAGRSCRKQFDVGSRVKGFKLPALTNDKTVTPGNYRGRVMLLNFWGTWCKPCLEELPKFDRLYRKYRKFGLTLVAVATDEDPEGVQAFVDKHQLRAKVALSGEEAASAYNRPKFPFTYLVDGEGRIVASYEFVSDDCMGELESDIREQLEARAGG